MYIQNILKNVVKLTDWKYVWNLINSLYQKFFIVDSEWFGNDGIQSCDL